MNTGKLVRLNRLFSHPRRRFLSVAVDHFIGYGDGLPPGLRHMAGTLEVVASGTHGGTVGRNIWGFDAITPAVRAFKAVIHDDLEPRQALVSQGLPLPDAA